MLRDLDLAVANDTLNLVFRPRLLLDSGRLWGAETTLRWPHRRHGLQGAGALYDMAGDTRLAARLTDWTLRHACRTAAQWGETPVCVSVRLIGQQWRTHGLADMAAQALTQANLPHARLELRIPEAALDHVSAADLLHLSQLRDLGIDLALEHFGDTVASLCLLRRLPISTLTLAPALLRHAAEDPADATLLLSVIRTARAMGLNVVACGVERQDQLAQLRASFCTAVQGGLFAQAGPASLVLPWLEPAQPTGAELAA